jgi:hypothetical protein
MEAYRVKCPGSCIFYTIGIEMAVMFSAFLPAALYSHEDLLVLISVTGLVNPRAYCGWKDEVN